MIDGKCGPLTCCDAACAGINHCQVGGYQCARCGYWFCGDELDEHRLCGECRDAVREEEESEAAQ